MADILVKKGGRNKLITSQDWKTGIPERDGWKIIQGEVSVETKKAIVAPSTIKPSILVQQPGQ